MSDEVSHPDWYGGEDNPYEVIKVLRAWNLELAKGFVWGNIIKYTQRADLKGNSVSDRRKAEWYAAELVSIEAELAGRAKKVPSEIPVVLHGNGTYKLHIDWDKRTTRLEYVSGSSAMTGENGYVGVSIGTGGGGGGGGGGGAGPAFHNYTINFYVADTISFTGSPDRRHSITVSNQWTLDMVCTLILSTGVFRDNEDGTKLGIACGPHLTALPGSMTVAKLVADYPNDERWLVQRDL